MDGIQATRRTFGLFGPALLFMPAKNFAQNTLSPAWPASASVLSIGYSGSPPVTLHLKQMSAMPHMPVHAVSGTLQRIIFGEKCPSRWVRNLSRIEVESTP